MEWGEKRRRETGREWRDENRSKESEIEVLLKAYVKSKKYKTQEKKAGDKR